MGTELWKVNKGVRQLANLLQSDCFTYILEMRGCASFRNKVILWCSRMSVDTHTDKTNITMLHSYLNHSHKTLSQSHGDNAFRESQLVDCFTNGSPFTIFNKHQRDKRHPAANKRNTAIKMASSCSERLCRVPEGWLHLGGVRMMLMLCLFDSDRVVTKRCLWDICGVCNYLTRETYSDGFRTWSEYWWRVK